MASESFIHFSESDVETTNALQLEGVWIHDPDDPEGTIHQFRFGRNNKSSSIDIGGKEQVFAGRRFPVYDFGEHQKDSVTVSVDRKSTRLNSSHVKISYAVFCLKEQSS